MLEFILELKRDLKRRANKNKTSISEEFNKMAKNGELKDTCYFTLEECSYLLDISRERVRQIETAAIKKLKHTINRPRMRDIHESAQEVSFGGNNATHF